VETDPVVSLFDANEERLDLMDRLARIIFDDFHPEITVRASSDLSEAMEDVDSVVLCLNEDGARRMVSGSVEEIKDVQRADAVGLRRGDVNRPTPVENLSPMTRQLLSKPKVLGMSREEAILGAVELFGSVWTGEGRVLSLMRGVSVIYESLEWPTALGEQELWMRPHQILRWINADESVFELVEAGRDSQFLKWLSTGSE
jgi:hypothetical protein